jgi:beta-lactamase class A
VALIDLVGLDAVHATLRSLGLHHTVIPTTLRDMLDSLGRDAGFPDRAALTEAENTSRSAAETARVNGLLLRAKAMRPETAIRTTARDMALLLCLIWRDEAGPPDACARVRELMSAQVTRHRLATGFPRHFRIAAKSGGLLGVLRHEIGVISEPGGSRYAAAVFTRAHEPWTKENEINASIGRAAALAIPTESEPRHRSTT